GFCCRVRPRKSPPMRACARSIWVARAMAEALLALDDVRAGYGDAVVLDGITVDVADGGSLAVLGRNGVGKSTLLLTIMGFTRVSRGAIVWRGRDITRVAPHWRARNGLGWVAQEREIFPSLSVEENLAVGSRPGRWDLTAVYRLFPRLNERRAGRGNHLAGGGQEMLAIARALMTNPGLLLLDEPLEGLAPIIVEELAAAIRRMTADEGTAFILVEQHAEVALSLTDDAIVLERGSIVHRARSQDLLKEHAVLDRLIGLRLAEQPSALWRLIPNPSHQHTSKLLRDEFQDLRALAVHVVWGFPLLRRFGLDCPRHPFIEQDPHCFVAGEHALFDESPKQRDRGGDRRHRIRRVFECVHLTLSGDDPNRSKDLTSLAISVACVKAVEPAREGDGCTGMVAL